MRTSARLGGSRRRLYQPRRRTVAALAAGLVWSAVAAFPARADTETTGFVAVIAQPDGSLAIDEIPRSSSRRIARELAAAGEGGTLVGLSVDEPVRALGAADPYRDEQWALDGTSFEPSWPVTTGTGAVVAVLDTGVQADHKDLPGAVLDGWDAITNSTGGRTDPHGHGTHVAGIIAAAASNGEGIAGAAPGVRILPVRVLGADGSGRLSDVLEGIIWAADHGADVINMSLGGGGNDGTYDAAIRYALKRGALVVAAGGNEALEDNAPNYPAAHPSAVAVAATTASRTRASFSNYGSYIDIAAPGSRILSTIPSGYASKSGTSMATPYVSAAAAMLAAREPGVSPQGIRDILEKTAQDLGTAGRDDAFGAGLVDPARALGVEEARPAPLPPAPPAPVPPPPAPLPPAPPSTDGYWVVTADGRVEPFGSAPRLTDVSGRTLNAQIVAAAATASGAGYWLAAADGAVFAFGDARFYGSAQHLRLNAPIVGMARSRTGEGYWLLGRDGGIFSFGDARFFGSTGDRVLNQPVVDIAATPSGDGYWFVASDGGVFSFGDARFSGSTGGTVLNQPVVSLTPDADGGYWLVGGDGGIFAFDAPFLGSLPSLDRRDLPQGRRIRVTTDGRGYYILGSDGRVFCFGRAADHGAPASVPAVDLILVPGR